MFDDDLESMIDRSSQYIELFKSVVSKEIKKAITEKANEDEVIGGLSIGLLFAAASCLIAKEGHKSRLNQYDVNHIAMVGAEKMLKEIRDSMGTKK
jgi:hypothetical protein